MPTSGTPTWSVHSIETYTGISRGRVHEALARLQQGQLLSCHSTGLAALDEVFDDLALGPVGDRRSVADVGQGLLGVADRIGRLDRPLQRRLG